METTAMATHNIPWVGLVSNANDTDLLPVREVVVSAGEEGEPTNSTHKHNAAVEIRERLGIQLRAVQWMGFALIFIYTLECVRNV